MNFHQRFTRVALFEGLTDSQRAQLEQMGSEVPFNRGEELFRQADSADALYVILRGRVKMLRSTASGETSLLEILTTGDDLDLAAIVDGKGHTVTAKVLYDGTAFRLPTPAFRRLLCEWPVLAANLLRLLATRQRALLESVTALGTMSVDERMCRALAGLAHRFGILGDCRGVILDLGLTRQDLADLTGSTLETAIRALNRLKDQGLVTWEGRRFFLPDLRSLESQVAA
ncbi:Crp/Fnr family transcriptional regulator [Myxococcota bacterium]|nr:Crp/Fnr family transcriptional regulator [Myxococcota bacterium]